MWFRIPSIFTPDKLGMDMEKTSAPFWFNFPGWIVVNYFCFDLISQCPNRNSWQPSPFELAREKLNWKSTACLSMCMPILSSVEIKVIQNRIARFPKI